MLIKIELLIISVIILKPKPSFVWLSKDSNEAARGGHCYFGLKKEELDPVMLFYIFSFTHLFTILGLILSANFITY